VNQMISLTNEDLVEVKPHSVVNKIRIDMALTNDSNSNESIPTVFVPVVISSIEDVIKMYDLGSTVN